MQANTRYARSLLRVKHTRLWRHSRLQASPSPCSLSRGTWGMLTFSCCCSGLVSCFPAHGGFSACDTLTLRHSTLLAELCGREGSITSYTRPANPYSHGSTRLSRI